MKYYIIYYYKQSIGNAIKQMKKHKEVSDFFTLVVYLLLVHPRKYVFLAQVLFVMKYGKHL